MKKILSVFAVILCLAVSCQKYDDSQIKKDISDLQEQVASLKAWCESSQAAIDAVAALQKAVANLNGIAYVEYFSSDNGTGYNIGLDDGQEITIYNVKVAEQDSYLGNIIISDANVIFTLTDGTTVTLPRKDALISFETDPDLIEDVRAGDTVNVIVSKDIDESQFLAMYAEVTGSDGYAGDVATKNTVSQWNIEVISPEFGEDGKCTGKAAVVFKSTPNGGDVALLNVSVALKNGNESSAALLIVPNSYPEEEEPLQFNYPVYVIGNVDDNATVLQGFSERSVTTVSDYKGVSKFFAVVDWDEFLFNEATILDVMKTGNPICVYNPDYDQFCGWLEDNKFPVVPSQSEGGAMIMAFCYPGNTYTLHNVQVTQHSVGEDEIDTPETYFAKADETDVAPYLNGLAAWVNNVLDEPELSSNGEFNYEDCTDGGDFPFTHRAVRVWRVTASAPDTITGTGVVSYSYRYLPLFCFSGNSNGDYYSVRAYYSIKNQDLKRGTPGMFKGERVEKWHSGIRTSYTAMYLKNFSVKVIPEADGMLWLPDKTPIPKTTKGAQTYSQNWGWNIGGGVSGGGGKKYPSTGGKEPSWEVKPNFTWGYSESQSISRTVPDIIVENNSSQPVPSWYIECKNLPKQNRKYKRWITDCPAPAKSGVELEARWVWYNPKTKAGDKTALKTNTKFTYEYDGIATDSFVTYCKKLSEFGWPPKGELAYGYSHYVPYRVTFGTVNIENTFGDGIYVKNISVIDTTTKKEVVASKSTLKNGEKQSIHIPVGQYSIVFEAGKTSDSVKKYRYKPDNGTITIKTRTSENDVTQLKSAFDFEEVK